MNIQSGEILRDEVLDTSLEAFGQANYGQLALDIMETVQRGSAVRIWNEPAGYRSKTSPEEIHAGMGSSPYRFNSDHELYEPLFDGDISRIPLQSIEEAVRKRLNPDELFFEYDFVPTPDQPRPIGYGTPFARLVPQPWQKEALARFITRPAPVFGSGNNTLADHSLTGAVGRAYDVMSLVSGVKTDVDPSTTEIDGPVVDYAQFRIEHLKAAGLSGNVRKHMNNDLRLLVMKEILSGTSQFGSYEVAVEGDTRVESPGYLINVKIDKISVESLKSLAQRTSNGTLAEAIYSL